MSAVMTSAPPVFMTALSQEELRARAHRLIPGGAHTYSKGDDQFPANAPAFIVRGQGAVVWGSDGREYIDWGMGLRSVVLGHAYPRVVEAAKAQLDLGSNFVRPSPLEGDLAEALLDLIPAADMVKFAKDGSDTTSAAVRLARAYTGRDRVVICQDNPFYSFNDWFIGSTPTDAGIPRAVSDLTLRFGYHDLAGLEALFEAYPDEIACVIIEPAATAPGPNGDPIGYRLANERNAAFLAGAKEICHRHGALIVFDEMISGFRWAVPGAQTFYGVEPDLSCFGKALGNGFSVSALAGRREIMDQGGIYQTERPRVFLLSATHGGETHALAAALAVIQEMQEQPVIEHIWRIGALLQRGLTKAIAEAGLQENVRCDHYPCSPLLRFWGADGEPSAALRTLFLQEMVKHGVLIPYIAPSFSHTDEHVA
ncbi:MAG: glutamate-1-semialdehyde 2,1-aminomutase, partial [Caldilineae bacterium]